MFELWCRNHRNCFGEFKILSKTGKKKVGFLHMFRIILFTYSKLSKDDDNTTPATFGRHGPAYIGIFETFFGSKPFFTHFFRNQLLTFQFL